MQKNLRLITAPLIILWTGQASHAQRANNQPNASISVVQGSMFIFKGGDIANPVFIKKSDVTVLGGEEALSKIIPLDNGKYFVLDVTCDRLAHSGKLSGCSVPNVNPANRASAEAASRLIKRLRISSRLTEAQKARLVAVSLTLKLSNSSVDAADGPCIGCVPIPPPPPPPSPSHN